MRGPGLPPMSESAQAEQANDGEQSDDQTDEVPTEAPEGAELIEAHEGIGTRNAAKVAFARMLVQDINNNERDENFPFAVEDVKWAEDSEYSLVEDGEFGLAAESVARTRRPIWTIQVIDQVLRAAAIVSANGDEMVPVNQETTPGDEFQRLYENCLESGLDAAHLLSANGLNDGMREANQHPDSFLAAEPTSPDTTESTGPSEDIFVTPDGTELDSDEAGQVKFDPMTGFQLDDVEVQSQADLAEMSEDDRDEYFGGGAEEDTEYELPEAPDEGSEEAVEEVEAEDAEATTDESDEATAEAEEADESEEVLSVSEMSDQISGVGEKTAEKLKDADIDTREKLREADTEALQEAGLQAGQIGNIKQNLGA